MFFRSITHRHQARTNIIRHYLTAAIIAFANLAWNDLLFTFSPARVLRFDLNHVSCYCLAWFVI